jgi:hypothetical protein
MDTNRRQPGATDDDQDIPVESLYELSGTPLPVDQDALLEPEEIEVAPEYTYTELDELLPQAVADPDETGDVLMAREQRSGETEDPNVAAEEGLVWVPPTDPPVVSVEGDEELEIAAGFGMTARDEPYDADHPATLLSAEDELTARVREAIRADAATTAYADSVLIATDGGVVVLKGVVDDIDDTDALAEVAASVDGVIEVRDELTVAGL